MKDDWSNQMPRELDISRLEKFTPKQKKGSEKSSQTKYTSENEEAVSKAKWPSREPLKEGQFTIRGPLTDIERFRALCKSDRRTYADMLRILMDKFENS